MKAINRGLWLGAAVAMATFAVGCGDLTGTDGGTGCSSDVDCATGQMCHPILQRCVDTCTGSSDCPSTAKTCATIDGQASGNDAGVKAFCQCSTDALCGGDLVCMDGYSLTCEAKCTSNTDCKGTYTCDTGSGKCVSGGGADAGTCDWSSCSTPDFAGSAGLECGASGCAAGASCSGTGQTTCANGSFCAGSVCGYPPFPTCPNFTPPGGKTPVWVPGNAGPVIYAFSHISHGTGQGVGGTDFTECPTTTTEWKIRLRAYRTDVDWPATRAGLSGFFYVDSTGAELDVLGNTLLLPNVGYNKNPSNPRDAEFQVYLCADNAPSTLLPGYYFTSGNESCRQLP